MKIVRTSLAVLALGLTVTNIDMAGELRDGDYLTSAAPAAADHLRHEKALLLDWLRTELREATGS